MTTAIRGATTVKLDNIEEVTEVTTELFLQIVEKNNLDVQQLCCIVFSCTSDIKSANPATVLRLSNSELEFVPLFCVSEHETNCSIKKCIRILLLTNQIIAKREVQHIYLRGAKNLRRCKVINIAIDGPGGAGKSTIAKNLAHKYNITYLDTGAMYRAVGLKVKRLGVDIYDLTKLTELLNNIVIDIKYIDGVQNVFLDGEDVSTAIREPSISKYASDVSALPACRLKLVDLQRQIANKSNCVLDGRDIGTYVLPNADLKIFLTASIDVRAKRRFLELQEKGFKIDYQTVYNDIAQRDKNDSTRAMAPLKKADDAIELDTSDMNIDQVLTQIDAIIKGKGLFDGIY